MSRRSASSCSLSSPGHIWACTGATSKLLPTSKAFYWLSFWSEGVRVKECLSSNCVIWTSWMRFRQNETSGEKSQTFLLFLRGLVLLLHLKRLGKNETSLKGFFFFFATTRCSQVCLCSRLTPLLRLNLCYRQDALALRVESRGRTVASEGRCEHAVSSRLKAKMSRLICRLALMGGGG